MIKMPSREVDMPMASNQIGSPDAKEFSIVGTDADLGIPSNPVGQVCKPQPPCATPPCRGCKPQCRHNIEGE